jgi:hypothetical protein
MLKRILLIVVVVCIAMQSSATTAACSSPKEVCDDIKWCLTTNPWPNGPDNTQNMAQLREAAQKGAEQEIYTWTDRCQRDVGSDARAWEKASAGCYNNGEWAELAKQALEGNCTGSVATRFYCVTLGKYYELGQLGPAGTGICRGPSSVGAACSCGSGENAVLGQVTAK